MEPKIVTLRNAEDELAVATKEKNVAEANLARVVGQLQAMQAEFEAAMANKKALEDDANATQQKMASANLLLHELSGWLHLSRCCVQATFCPVSAMCTCAEDGLAMLGGDGCCFRCVHRRGGSLECAKQAV